jgi:hypothetical protein
MSLEDINHVSQTISALAIVASLIFVAVQLRRAEKYQRAIMHQGRASLVVDAFLRAAEGPAAQLLAKARSGATDFTAVELAQLTMTQRAITEIFLDTLTQYEAKLLDRATFEQARNWGQAMFALPAMRVVWQMNRQTYAGKVVDIIEQMIKEAPAETATTAQGAKA